MLRISLHYKKRFTMIKVYATCFWQSDAELLSDITKYGFGKAQWKNLVFTDSKDFDVAVVLTAPWSECHDFAPNRAIRFLTEPPVSSHHRDVADTLCPMYLPLPWWINSARRSEIVKVRIPGEKTGLISSVTSELAYMDGHIKRLKFLRALDSVVDEGLDIFGKQYSGEIFSKFQNYRGELNDKYDGLIPYEYHINCENSFENDYFTEKLLDPIIAESLCFYDGCTNVEKFIDPRAFVRIEIDNIEESALRIEQCVNGGYYEKQLPHILREKRRILYEFNPLNIIWAQVNGYDTTRYFIIN